METDATSFYWSGEKRRRRERGKERTSGVVKTNRHAPGGLHIHKAISGHLQFAMELDDAQYANEVSLYQGDTPTKADISAQQKAADFRGDDRASSYSFPFIRREKGAIGGD